MLNVKFISFLLVSIFLTTGEPTQADPFTHFYPHPDIEFLDASGKPFKNPFAGGMLKPQFSNIDLNGNGNLDLFVFDRSDGQIMTFINTGHSGSHRFQHAPQFVDAFPELRNFVHLADYNHNGKMDIFTYSPPGKNGIRVYKNISNENGLAFEMATDQLLYKSNSGNMVNIYLLTSDIPVIADISGDGALDILTFGPLGQYVDYYQNISFQENNHYDSLTFRKKDNCWGRFNEALTDNEIDLGIWHSWCEVSPGKNKKHSGATMLALDMDGTGDKDLILGDIENTNLKRLVNGKNSHFDEPYPRDTMVELIMNFPTDHPVEIETMPAGYYVDITGNGIRDLVVAPNDRSSTKTINQVWYYRNNGKDDKPDFSFRQENFLQETMADLGYRSAPAFFDYTGNGLKDLVVATGASQNGYREQGDRLVLFINEGTAQKPVFKLKEQDFLSLSQYNWEALHPAFGDLTGNGREDLLLGNISGSFIFLENTASSGEKAKFSDPVENYAGLQVNSFSTPFLVDYNGNGLTDIIAGGMDGKIRFFKNESTGVATEFSLETDFLGKIRTNDSYQQIIYENGQPVDTVTRYLNEGGAAPVVADVNGDGSFELITGSLSRGLLVYKVLSNPEDSFPAVNELFYSYLNGGVEFTQGDFLKPAIMNPGDDHFPVLFCGNLRGGLFGFSSVKTPPPTRVREGKPKEHSLRLYPNPGDGHFTIESNSAITAGSWEAILYDLSGRQISRKIIDHAGGKQIFITFPDVPPGVTLLKLVNKGTAEVYRFKVIIR